MRKSGLTNGALQHLQRLAGAPSDPLSPRVSSRPQRKSLSALVPPRRAWRPYEEQEGVGLEEGSEAISDVEIAKAVMDAEGANVLEESAERAVSDALHEEALPEENRRDDPMLSTLPEEPWDADWKITARALHHEASPAGLLTDMGRTVVNLAGLEQGYDEWIDEVGVALNQQGLQVGQFGAELTRMREDNYTPEEAVSEILASQDF